MNAQPNLTFEVATVQWAAMTLFRQQLSAHTLMQQCYLNVLEAIRNCKRRDGHTICSS